MIRRNFLKDIFIMSVVLGVSRFRLYSENENPYTGYDERKCKETWKKLCGKIADRDYMRYVSPKENLPNVFIYGDSISQDYTETVRSELRNE